MHPQRARQGQFPGMKTGDADVYKAFACGSGISPATMGEGLASSCRDPCLMERDRGNFDNRHSLAQLEITCVLNTRWWVFDDSAQRYAIALTCITEAIAQASVPFSCEVRLPVWRASSLASNRPQSRSRETR